MTLSIEDLERKRIQEVFNANIDLPQFNFNVPQLKLSPEILEQERLQEASEEDSTLSQVNLNTLKASLIENASPDDLKAMALAKIPLLLIELEIRVKQFIIKSLEDLIRKEISKFLSSNTCPPKPIIDNIIRVRNNIVDLLNNIGKQVKNSEEIITTASNSLNTALGTIRTINIASIGSSLAAKAFPSPPGLPGVIASSIVDAQKAVRDITFDDEGNSKLTKISFIIGGASLVISMISISIQLAITLLNSIDAFLKKCAPNDSNSITSISKDTKDIANSQAQASTTQNQTTYQGFIIEIEEVPFTPTVTRRRAVGKNQSGIKLTQTELSFSTNNQTLINELKFIIDRDNLKAY